MFGEDGLERENDAGGFIGVAMKFGEGEIVVEFGVVKFGPVNEIEIFLRLEEREDLNPHGRENDVGVAGAVEGDPGEEPRCGEEGNRHPPSEIGVAKEPGESNQKEEGKEHGGSDEDPLGLSGASEAEFLVRFGDGFWGGHVGWDS